MSMAKISNAPSSELAGDMPAKVRTASGKLHLIYAYNGEHYRTA